MAESIEIQIQDIKFYTPRLETLKRTMPTATSTAAENVYPSLEAVKRTMPTATSTAAAPFGPHWKWAYYIVGHRKTDLKRHFH